MQWRVGCSGFHYKEWKGVFYPEKMPQRQWFEFYGSRFNTLELNVTFYRFPQVAFLENWYNKSPKDFLFSAKVPRLITHYKQFRDTAGLVRDFYTTVRAGLREKLGPVLFQLPPQYTFTEERLELLLLNIDPAFDNVIEFRDKSWWRKEVENELTRRRVCFCGISYPGLPDQVVVNTNMIYYRFHGISKLYYSGYDDAALKRVFRNIQKSGAEKAFIFFNNTATGAAIDNATTMEGLIAGKQEKKRIMPG